MPIYAYKCATCGHADDVMQKMSADALTTCPKCGAETYSKQVTAAGFALKGSGWYVTDFRSGNTGAPKPAAEAASDAAGADSGKPDAKPDSVADKKSDTAATPATAEKSPSATPAAPAASSPAPAAKPAAPAA